MNNVIKLPKLISQAELKKVFANDPLGAIEKLVRTTEELSEVVDSLTSGPMDYDPSQIEALILWIIQYSYTDKEAEKVIRWYGLCDTDGDAKKRRDFDFIRAFRFLLQDDTEDIRLQQVLFGLHYRPWYGTIINDMVRKHPYLYWCHKSYQEHIVRTLEEFLKRDHSKPYSDREWQPVERAIRRVVDAGDWSLSKQVHDIYRLNKEIGMWINERHGEGKDPFTPNRIKTFLEDAVGFLARQRSADSMSTAQAFGTALETRGDFSGKIRVEVSFPKDIYIKEGENGISPLSVAIFAQDLCDRARLTDILSRVSLEFEIDGGYFPTIDGNNERRAFFEESSGAIGEYEFAFVPFEGRGRLTLTLLYRDKDSAVESFTITSRHFFEAKAAEDKKH